MYVELPYDLALFAIRLLSRFKIKIMEEEAVKYGGFCWFMDSTEAEKDLDYHVGSAKEVLAPVVHWLQTWK